jgi:hypothetical protein
MCATKLKDAIGQYSPRPRGKEGSEMAQSREELIRKLTEAIGNFVCTSCDHPLRLHLDEYGCEQEGPDIEGNEGVPAHASGPCGCVGGSPAEDALIEALRAAKKARE